jgi:glycerol-3-phosphate acyltransferase PlsY
VTALIVIAIAFLLGSIPSGVLLAKQRGIDIKKHGSGNIGATNVTRVLGLYAGGAVLLVDAAKGALAVSLATKYCGAWVVAAAGFAAILGHCFSPWLGGKGGKGVATALGAFVVISPPLAAIAVLIFGAVLAVTRVPALGSLAAMFTIAGILVVRGDRPAAALACATAALLVYTHRANLAKLRG